MASLLPYLIEFADNIDNARSSIDREGRERAGNRIRDRNYALVEARSLSERDFKIMFRMSRASFTKLLHLITPYMPPEGNTAMATISSGSRITNETKLYCTLRWLAGGSYLDITFAFGVSKAAFFRDGRGGIVWPTMYAMDSAFVIGMPLGDVTSLRRLADEYKICSNGMLKDCVLAIDGWVCKTRKPQSREVECVMAYRNR